MEYGWLIAWWGGGGVVSKLTTQSYSWPWRQHLEIWPRLFHSGVQAPWTLCNGEHCCVGARACVNWRKCVNVGVKIGGQFATYTHVCTHEHSLTSNKTAAAMIRTEKC